MKLKFDLDDVIVTEFGVGIDDGNEQTFAAVPAGAEVQTALHEMVQATWEAMQGDDTEPTRYQPSEKHGSIEYLYLPIGDYLAKSVRELHNAKNLKITKLDDPSNIFCYFTRLTDNKDRCLTALRRASQFKGVLKKRLIRILNDTLKIIEDSVFKLDNDFDLLVDSVNVHILRPSGFEFAGKLQEAILNAVPKNMKSIRKDLPFVDFDGIEKYASTRPRAARCLASILAQEETKNIDKTALKHLCKLTRVNIKESKGKITVSEGHEMGFLEVLDRRRYEISLVKEKPEHYLAGSRRKING